MRGIDEAKVTRWLADNVEGAVAPFEFDLIAGGRSNLTYKFTGSDGRPFVLRRPPLGHVLESAHDMRREHTIISAVGKTSVPVAPALGLCMDTEVNGAPFYVMGFVEGAVVDAPDKAALLTPAMRRAASEHLVDVLAALHAVDIDEVGLGDLARRDSYIERQLKRWSKQWADSKTRELPAIDEVELRLRDHVPPQTTAAIVHGDYRFGNCLTDVDHGRIAAVLDWELCTLGDPLADVGYLLIYWSDKDHPARRANDPTAAGGFLSRQEVLDRYHAATGRDLSGIDFYIAFSSWRLAVIGEGVMARYIAGVMGDDPFDVTSMREGTDTLAASALEAARRLDQL
jgi:aminoglycoside phosphotransferase (APT) family kinase protein